MIPSLGLLLVALCARLSATVDFRDDPYLKSLSGLEACSAENKAACFFLDYCDRQGASASTLVLYNPQTMPLTKLQACPAVAIFKKFTDRNWLVILLLRNDKDGAKKMEFKLSGGGLLFGCKSDDGRKVDVVPGLFKTETHYAIVRNSGMLCKFTVAGNLPGKLMSEQRAIQLDTLDKSYKYGPANEAYPKIFNTGTCDPGRLTFHSQSLDNKDKSETSLWPLVEFEKISCPAGSKLKSTEQGAPIDVTIECQEPSKKFLIKSGEKVIDPSLKKFACTAKTCTRCGDIDLPQGMSTAVKPKFTPAAGDQCADLACENDRIELPGMNATVAKPFCKQFAPGDFRWAIKVSGEERAFLAAACPSMVKCNDVQPIRDFCESPACSQMTDPWLSRVYCEHKIATKPAGGDWSLIASIDCDEKLGVWMKAIQPGPKVKLEPNEKIKCLTSEEAAALQKQGLETTTTQNSDAAPSTGGGPFPMGGWIAIAMIVVIVMLIIFGFAFYKIHKRKKAEEAAIEVDAKPPSPPGSVGDSEAAGGSVAEVSFSGTKRDLQTPSLKSAKSDWASAPKQFVKAELPQPASSTKAFEAGVSVTHRNVPPEVSDGTSGKPTPPPMPSEKSAPPKPADASAKPPLSDESKKKLKELLDQSLPSMSE